jgi:hypothetical protein
VPQIPAGDAPKTKRRNMVKDLAIGSLVGLAVGAVLAWVMDSPALYVAGALGGALVGLWFGEETPQVPSHGDQ